MSVSQVGSQIASQISKTASGDSSSTLQNASANKIGKSDAFGDLLADLLNSTNESQKNSANAIKGLATGEVENVHDVVLAVAEADLAFRLILEIRNKLLDTYQEIMRMQF